MRSDDMLLDQLRTVAAAVDPVPADASLAARSALAYLRLDAALAGLTYDSWEQELAGVRAPAASDLRLLTFEADPAIVEVQTTADGRVEGLVVDAQARAVVLETANGQEPLSVDEHGRFAFDRPSTQPLRFRIELADATVVTAWMRL